MTDQTPQDILNAAADLIERTGWTQGEFAKDADGDPVSATSPFANCFCMFGAIYRVTAEVSPRGSIMADLAEEILAERVGYDHFSKWNDHPDRTKEEVIAALRGVSNE